MSQAQTFDANNVSIDNDGVHAKNLDVSQLQSLYDELDFPNYLKRGNYIYPRVFVQNIPHDYASIEDLTYRNELFIKMLMPIVLKVNHEYEEEHENLLAIKYAFYEEKDFHELDCYYIDLLAKKYEIVTPYKDTRKYIMLLEELLLRADSIPPSILVATAAIYTDWGTSRIAIEGNNLYKAKNWYSDEGIKPLSDDKDYTFKIYDSLEDSIRDYILKVNQSVNYKSFWQTRQMVRKVSLESKSPIYGKQIDWSFVLENNLGNYTGLLDYTITYYRMMYLDQAELEDVYDFED
jgi:uncharacterized FlgJ-related protein